MALVNQKMGAPQGVPGFALYKLVSKQPNAFHDIPTGSTIGGPCASSSPNCKTNTAGDIYGVLTGYSTTTGYDLATGLGSVDAANLVNNWSKATFTATTSTLTLNNGNAINVTHGTAVPVSIALTPTGATGNTALLVNVGPGTTTGKAIDFFPLSEGSVSGTTSLLPAGTYNVIAHYGGDGTYGGSYSNAVSVTVNKENSTVSFPGLQLGGNSVTTVKYDDQYTVLAAVKNAGGLACNPPPYGEIVCPTGTITLSDGGTTLGTGPYNLDQTGSVATSPLAFFLNTGAHTLTATYSGDSNFKTGTASIAVTVNPASTYMPAPYTYGGITVGVSPSIGAEVDTTSYGAAPTGTITIYANGKALTGGHYYNSRNGNGGSYADLGDFFSGDSDAFSSPGTYAITASYSGDSNYASSTSAVTNVVVQYPTPYMTMTPSSQNVANGGTATVVALVGSQNAKTYPSGTITFVDGYNGNPISGPTTCTKTTDSSGNYACQASASFTVTNAHGVWANYSGDTNYPSASAFAVIAIPDFSMDLDHTDIELTAGQSQALTFNIGSMGGFNGTVSNFSCTGLPAEATCTFGSPQLTADPNQWVSTPLTITTAAVGQSRRGMRAENTGPRLWFPFSALLVVGACFIGFTNPRLRALPLVLMLCGTAILLPSCGGGSSNSGGGGGGGGNNNPVPHITSLSPTQLAVGSQINTVTVTGTNFMSNSVLTVGNTPEGWFVSPTQMQFSPTTDQLAATGQFPVMVTNPGPGGGSSNAMNLVVTTGTPTGNFFVTISATGAGFTHTMTLAIGVR